METENKLLEDFECAISLNEGFKSEKNKNTEHGNRKTRHA